MKNIKDQITISSSTVLFSKDTSGYQFVFSNLSKAKHLYISTFNYYMEENHINELMKNLRVINDIRVVFNTYNKDTIEKIILQSLKVNPFVQLYYHENNHSKIVSSGRQMYLGSANYSGYSKNNYEVGVKIEDELAISGIENEVFNNLYEYRVVITDPVQPLITYFTIIQEEIEKCLNCIEWFFGEAMRSSLIGVNDIDDLHSDMLGDIEYVFKTGLEELKKFVNKKSDDFKEEGIHLTNFIDEIQNQIRDINEINIGSSSKASFESFYEEYTHCNEKYKEQFWVESMITIKREFLYEERAISDLIKTILEMLLYLKVKWIEDYRGVYNKAYYMSNEKCVNWLCNGLYPMKAMRELIE